MEEEFNANGNLELPAVIGALLDLLDDKDEDVKRSVIESIEKISAQKPDIVIHAAVYFWELHKKISSKHMSSLLSIMSHTCEQKNLSLNTDLASSVVELAVTEIIENAKNEASELLIVLSRMYCTQTMGGLLTRLEPGIMPHYMVVRTIGLIAASNPDGMLCFFKIASTIMLPMLQEAREEKLKQAFCFTFGKMFEAINEYIMNSEEESKPEITKETYKEEVHSIFITLTSNSLKQFRDNSSVDAALTALIPMILLLPENFEYERMVKLIPVLLNFCKKPATRLSAIRLLSALLTHTTVNDKEMLRPFLEQLHQSISELINVSPFEACRDVVLTHYEALQCCRLLVILYPEEALDRILQQLKSTSASYKCRSLVVLKHLINTLPAEDDATLQRITLNLQDCLGDNGTRQMVGAIVALAARPSLPLLPSQRAVFVRYMVLQCGEKSAETEAYSEALYLLATTVDGAESWLWPCLLSALLDPIYTASAPCLLRALSALAVKVMHNGTPNLLKDFHGIKVLSRCLELLDNPKMRLGVIHLLKSATLLFGHQLKSYWDGKLLELEHFLHDERVCNESIHNQRYLNWEEKMVEFLEESVKAEGEAWGSQLADELVTKKNVPSIMPFLASICNSNAHISLVVQLAHSHGMCDEFARAVGICAKRHLNIVLRLTEELCSFENTRKIPGKLLGLVKDTKAAATAESAKSGLLKSYAEIAQRANPDNLYSSIEKHIAPWIIRQLNESKELITKIAGLRALEQVSNSVKLSNVNGSKGLCVKAAALATLLGLLQSSSGHKPLQLYPFIMRTAVSLIRMPPELNEDEREVFLSTVLDKIINASSEIVLLLEPDTVHQIIDELGILCTEVVSDSADALAEFVDVLLPWMQSKSAMERKTTLLVLRTTLTSYCNCIKYTFPGGKLVPGKLLGRIISWSSDSELELRSLVIDCIGLSLNVAARHRSILLDNGFEEELRNSMIIPGNEANTLCDGIKNLATAVSNRIPSGEIVSLAEGLIEGLLYRGEAALAAATALTQHFNVKGSEIARTNVHLVDSIIAQMKQMENTIPRQTAAAAVASLMYHHSEEVIERLLLQPLPLSRSCEECWEAVGTNDELGSRVLGILLLRLDNNNLFNQNATGTCPEKKNTAYFPSLAAIMVLKHIFKTLKTKFLIETHLSELLSVLLKYLTGWLEIEAPVSLINTKFGFVPDREASKINPHAEVYFILIHILRTMDSTLTSNLAPISGIQGEECIISVVRVTVQCICKKHEVVLRVTQSLGKLMSSMVPLQRAAAVTIYAELFGKINLGAIWLDAIVSALHEAKADSSPLVRKLATIGLSRIAYLEPKQVTEYFDNCMDALLNGLEEPASGQRGSEVILESLRGLSVLLSVELERSISPRIILALKPFIEKENWKMTVAAICALGTVAARWQKSDSTSDDDITDHLLGCLPCLLIRLADPNLTLAKITQETLYRVASLLQSDTLCKIMFTHLGPQAEFNFETFLRSLVYCLQRELPQRAEELRNAVVRGYFKSENCNTRATAALILGVFGPPQPEDVQRLLQLLRDKESNVRIQAARALSLCFTT